LYGVQAGAKHVYGIERSAIAEQAKQIVADNGYQSKVTIIQGKVEEVDLPVEKVCLSVLHGHLQVDVRQKTCDK
jgi:protein arginine N-methyltransferase 1